MEQDRPTVEAVGRQAHGDAAASGGLTRGAEVGRYLVIERVAEGGMGVVYSAYDPQLDRRVALKVVRGDSWDEAGRSAGRARLVREARAMASLSHPNVVPVYDAGNVGDDVFMAMELVHGDTLRAWLAQASRTPREIVRVLFAAGRGLAAAHEAGMIHRDFKPGNVLIGSDGQVRVTDFGLARAAPGRPDGDDALPPTRAAEPGETLTGQDGWVGTPGYMAPEQFRESADVDARSDQFAFCVTLFEALCGRRPFEGDNSETLTHAIERGDIAQPPRAVPRWLNRIVRRGLSARPDQRYPSMAALLRELGRDRDAARRRWLAGGTVAVLAAALAGPQMLGDDTSTRCRGAETKVEHAWSRHKPALRDAFRATGAPYAEDVWASVQQRLDAYMTKWAAMHTEACEATHVRGEQSEALLDARMRCLTRGLAEVEAVVALWQEPDDVGVQNAVQAAFGLESLDRCEDPAASDGPMQPPSDVAAVEALRAGVTEVRTLRRLGRYEEARSSAEAAVTTARALDYPPALAEALVELGVVYNELAQFDQAERALRDAAVAARAGLHLRQEALAWTWLVFVVGNKLARPDEGRELVRLARASVKAAGDELMLRANLANHHGVMLRSAGRAEQALPVLEESVALWEQVAGPDDPRVAGPHTNLGNVLFALHRYADAKRQYARSLEITTRAYGPSHPGVAIVYMNLCGVSFAEDHYEEAERHCLKSLEIRRAASQAGHSEAMYALLNLGSIAFQRGESEASLRYFREALPQVETQLPPDHPMLATARVNVGMTLCRLGKYEEASALHDQADAVLTRTLPVGHRYRILMLASIGECLWWQDKRTQAVERYEQAVAMAEHAPAEARRDLADARFLLARALWEMGRDRRRALRLATDARDNLIAVGANEQELDAWLAERESELD